jgi:hypothetical protein
VIGGDVAAGRGEDRVELHRTPYDDDPATRQAAERLVAFLKGELEQLPPGHAWRRGYTRELIRAATRYEISVE